MRDVLLIHFKNSTLKKIELDKTLGWEVAQVLNVDTYASEVKLVYKKKKAKIFFENLKWTKKKNFNELINAGDLIMIYIGIPLKNSLRKFMLRAIQRSGRDGWR